MSDPLLKVTDVSSLKELAHVLTYPLIAVAYFIQTGATISWGGADYLFVPESLSDTAKAFAFFGIFALKSIWICSLVGVVDIVLTKSGWYYAETVLLVASIILFGIGLLGIFATDEFVILESINRFWFIASIVWGFACLVRVQQIQEVERSAARTRA